MHRNPDATTLRVIRPGSMCDAVVVDCYLSRFQRHQHGFCFVKSPGQFLTSSEHVVFIISIIMGQDLTSVGSWHDPHTPAFLGSR